MGRGRADEELDPSIRFDKKIIVSPGAAATLNTLLVSNSAQFVLK